MPRIDAHGHLIPERYRAELERLRAGARLPAAAGDPGDLLAG